MAIPTTGTPITTSDLNNNFIDVKEDGTLDTSVTVKVKNRAGDSSNLFTYSRNSAYSGSLVTAEGAKTKLEELSPKIHLHTLSSIGPWSISVSQDNVITFEG